MHAADLIADISTALQDPDYVRWSAAELVGYVNDGQRFIVAKSPTASAREEELTLVAGARQGIPPGARLLLEVLRNVGGKQAAVSQVARSMMDACLRLWAGQREAAEVIHFMADARTPRLFDVYPPVEAGVKVLALLCMEPQDTPTPVGGVVLGDVFLDDDYRNALRHYALFRAFSKDSEGESVPALAQAHLQLCMDALGINVGHPATSDDPST